MYQYRKYKIIKQLSSWPLSEVNLISVGDQPFILKVIHSDFKKEVSRQEHLAQTLRTLYVPKVYDQWSKENKTFFIMDYIEPDTKASEDESLNIINVFHTETTINSPELFPTYNINAFLCDYKEVKQYINPLLHDSLNSLNFEKVFNQKQSIVHGDWETNQILIQKEKVYLIDFSRSFYGPSILDYAYICRERKDLDQQVIALLDIDKTVFDLAKIVFKYHAIGMVSPMQKLHKIQLYKRS